MWVEVDVCRPCRWAHFVFVEEYGGPQHKTFDWFNSITRVRVFFKLEINGKEMKHDFDWEAWSSTPSLPPSLVRSFARREKG